MPFILCLVRTANFPIIVRGELAIVTIVHKEKLKHTILSIGKNNEIRRGKKLTDP